MNTKRVSATLPAPVAEEVGKLEEAGYRQAEIVTEGVRLFIQKKKAEGAIPA
jgi:hypothetical protein